MMATESSVVMSLRALAELEDERVEREREQLARDARAAALAVEERRAEEAARREREEASARDEALRAEATVAAAKAAALERVRLEYETERDRQERPERTSAETRKIADDRLREAELALAAAGKGARFAPLLHVVHGVVTASLVLALVGSVHALRQSEGSRRGLERAANDAAHALAEERAANDDLTQQLGVALAPRRADTPATPAVDKPTATSAPTPPSAHHPPRTSDRRPETPCSPHDPLCGYIP